MLSMPNFRREVVLDANAAGGDGDLAADNDDVTGYDHPGEPRVEPSSSNVRSDSPASDPRRRSTRAGEARFLADDDRCRRPERRAGASGDCDRSRSSPFPALSGVLELFASVWYAAAAAAAASSAGVESSSLRFDADLAFHVVFDVESADGFE